MVLVLLLLILAGARKNQVRLVEKKIVILSHNISVDLVLVTILSILEPILSSSSNFNRKLGSNSKNFGE